MDNEFKIKPPKIELNGTRYEFRELTVGQMEQISELLEDARRNMIRTLTEDLGGGLNAARKVVLNVSDLLADLRKTGKFARFLAIVMSSNTDKSLEEKEADFKQCPYDKAEAIFGYFFTIRMFEKLLIPGFLLNPPQTDSTAKTQSEK